jgi:hypothetical protein
VVVTLAGATEGQAVAGGLQLEARVSAAGVARVDFDVDGAVVRSERTAPYCLGGDGGALPCSPWDTRQVADGARVFRATAYGSAGALGHARLTLLVQNGPSPSPSPTPTPAPSPSPSPTPSPTPTPGQPADADLRFFAGDDLADTYVATSGERFTINGTATYAGRSWNGASMEGLLLNSRMVNGIYDDLDGSPPSSMQPWNPRTNTQAFIAQMPGWKAQGLAAFTLGLQGGSNSCAGVTGDLQDQQGILNNPFGTTGTRAFDDWYANRDTPYARYLARLGSIIRAADDQGLVVILNLFYFGQDQQLASEAAVVAAVDATVDWVVRNRWANVLIEVANESNIRYQHAILQPARVPELLRRIKSRSGGGAGGHLPHGRLLASVSGSGGYMPPDAWVQEADFVLLHGNSRSAPDIQAMADTVRAKSVWQAKPKPIVFNEDSTNLDNFKAAVGKRAGWGYYDDRGYQCVYGDGVTDRWSLGKASNAGYWPLVAEMTGGGATAATTAATTASGGGFVMEAEQMALAGGYGVDPSNPGWIMVNGSPSGTAVRNFEGESATYQVLIDAVAEPDGQSRLELWVGGVLQGEYTYPLSSSGLQLVTITGPTLSVAKGTEVKLVGYVDDTAVGMAHARVNRIRFVQK